jgi:carbon monoxide dehydrogenase subunit G
MSIRSKTCARSNPSSVNDESAHTMNIQDEFKVGVPVEEAWRVFLDVERIAPCMPGAQLQEVEGDEYRGIVKVKVGPITAQYKGAARIVEADEAARRIVIKAEGRDTRGQGNASATITATMAPDGDGTTVGIDTDLNVTGKVAQFGRGVMADVSTKLLGQFVTCLHETVLVPGGASGSGEAAPAPAAATPAAEAPAAPAVRKIDAPEAAPVDLMKAAGGAVMKRAVPAAIAAVIVVGIVVWLLSR